MAGKKTPNPIDVHVGSRMRMRRMMLGLSQEKLGESLGISFQQVQKYEKGTNRIGAGRLQGIATTLEVPVSYFYEDLPGQEQASGFSEEGLSYVSALLTTQDGMDLTQAFLQINNPKLRRRVVELVKGIVEDQQQRAST